MKKETINNYYTDEDLIYFKKLNNFKEIKNNNPSNNQTAKHLFKYSTSDNNNFNKIMNIKNSEIPSSKVHKSQGNNYYNSSDFQKLNKLKELTNFNFSEDLETKKENLKTETSYTSEDVNKFDKIIKTESKNTNNTETNNRKIKIIDFNKLKENKKNIKNKLGIDKIKIVYFD